MKVTALAFVPWLLSLAAAAGGYLWSAGDRTAALGHQISSGEAAIGGPFRLIDQNGAARSDRDFRGRYMLVYFGYSSCPDVCPTTLGEIADAYAALGTRRTQLVPVFVTLDPARDTPKVLKGYLAAFGPEFVGLTGSERAIRNTAAEYRVYYSSHKVANGYAIDHTGAAYLMDRAGRFLTFYDEDSLDPKLLLADLRKRF
ncbi:MAG: SCO family protein [Alphaproteobacteria bacterium]|nr:SCO family protein [Alphaproteobacteria bacterium]